MRLVIDANILMSMLISGSKRSVLLDKVELFAPEFLLGEIWKHEKEIQEKSKLSLEDFRLALEILVSKIHFIPFVEFSLFIQKAADACPDPDDVEYFAVAIAFSCPLWSNDKRLKSQSEVRVLSTSELLQLLSTRN